jgi:hypothetical protein
VTPLTTARLGLLLAGIALFIYSMRTGVEWARLAAIGLLVLAVVIRFVDRYRNRQR